MTYLSTQPLHTDRWEDICFPVGSVLLSDLMPGYEIMASDRQKIITGSPLQGPKVVYGVQSQEYGIIPNSLIRELVDELVGDYTLKIRYTYTGDFNISVVLPGVAYLHDEQLSRSLVINNSYNGKTRFSVQGIPVVASSDAAMPFGSMFRSICENMLTAWADRFDSLDGYQRFLRQHFSSPLTAKGKVHEPASDRKMHAALSGTLPMYRNVPDEQMKQKLRELIRFRLTAKENITRLVYQIFCDQQVSDLASLARDMLPIPTQVTRQALERLTHERRLLKAPLTFWLLYNAINYALFNARSSMTLSDRLKADEQIFHKLAAMVLTV